MELYFAPLEGITTYTFRNTHAEMFGGCDAYFAPFITPSDIERVSIRSFRDLMPDKNIGIELKAQVLTSQADSFLKFADKAKEIGFREININLGCPSGTVVKKGRGSGFLRDPDGLDRFFYEIFSKTDVTVSVKTRTGYESGEEMARLMGIYNKYPISLLTIHPRARMDFYGGVPDMEVFDMAYKMSKNKVCYNGNVFTKEEYEGIIKKYPDLGGVMFGRGAIKNPALFREIRGGEKRSITELIEFTERLIDNYNGVLKSDYFTLGKLKEIWMYIMWDYPEEKKVLKAIKKSSKLSDLTRAIGGLKYEKF